MSPGSTFGTSFQPVLCVPLSAVKNSKELQLISRISHMDPKDI